MPHARSAAQKRHRNSRRRKQHPAHPWLQLLDMLKNRVPRFEHRDGAGAPWVTQWDMIHIPEENWSKVLTIVARLSSATSTFLDEHRGFVSQFLAADRETQTILANGWLPLQDVAKELRVELEHLMVDWGYESAQVEGWGLMKLWAMLTTEFEVAPDLTEEDDWKKGDSCSSGLEDTVICDMMCQGVSIGYYGPFPENKAWPPFTGADKYREGEPLDGDLRWVAEKFYDLKWAELPIGRIEPDMDDKLQALIDSELASGRIKRVSEEEVVAYSKQLAIWKPNKSDIRPLDDYRRSGLNMRIRRNLRTTICLPRLRDICAMLAETCISESFKIIEIDLEHAFRVVKVCQRDRALLGFIRPGQKEEESLEIFQHQVLPFGLITSPTLFCRGAAVGFRVKKRFLAIALAILDGCLPLAPVPIVRSGKTIMARCVKLDFRSMIYVDDVSESMAKHAGFAVVFTLLTLLVEGFPISFHKVKALSQEAHILGFEVAINNEGNGLRLGVPSTKVDQICAEIEQFCETKSVKILNRVEGRLTWAAQIVRPLSRKLNAVRSLTAVAQRKGLRYMRVSRESLDAVRELGELLRNQSYCTIPCIPRRGGVDQGPEIPIWCICTDASLYGVAGIIFPLTTREYCSPGTTLWFNFNRIDDDKVWKILLSARRLESKNRACAEGFIASDINFLELAAVGLALKMLEYSDQRVGYVYCLTDNTATAAVIKKLKGRSASLNKIVDSVGFSQFQIGSSYLPGEFNNIADTLSRSSLAECRTLVPEQWVEVPDALQAMAATHLFE